MSDDVSIPALGSGPGFGSGLGSVPSGPMSPSYRARRGGPQAGTGVIKIAAVALMGLALAGTIGWAVMNRRPATVPVIEADSRPLRVKPDNPGGMQVAGADELVLGDSGDGRDKMAPVAETPAPQALRAQMQQQATPPAGPVEQPPAPVLATPAGGIPPVIAQRTPAPTTASTPAPSPVLKPSPDTSERAIPAKLAPTPPAHAAAGAIAVQLGALTSEAAAQAEWQRLARSIPGEMGGRQPSVQKIDHDGRIFWRLRTGGFADVADATGFCVKMKAKGASCTIASF